MKKSFYIFCLIMLPWLLPAQQNDDRPKLGLTLSGGGAKGIAHIGLLMAIDEAGLHIDYVSGTSMGAIVGGLYAAGYSGKEIAGFVEEMDWKRILRNKPDYEQLILPHKEDNRQFVEIPLVDGKMYFGKGMLESNELWLWLCNHFSAYNREIDFSDLPRPFKCVATRLDNGDAVILEKGNLVRAIRASMAIPSVFTPVSIDSNVLVDGGLVRNLPVSEVRDLGADIVIGSSVTDNQLSSEDLSNPLEIISQIAFYTEKRDYRKQVEDTDLFVDYPIEKYSAGSFSHADEILAMGIQRGREMLPALIRLRDSLDQIYGVAEIEPITPVLPEKVFVKEISVDGLGPVAHSFFMTQMNLRENREYTTPQISNKIRNSFATGIFRKINFSFTENPDTTVNMHLDFERDYRAYIRAGLAYNEETGLAIKLGAARHSGLSLFSTSSVGLSIGENPQFSARNLYFFGNTRSLFLETTLTGELTELSLFNKNLASVGVFRQNHLRAEMNLIKLLSKNIQLGLGTRWEYLTYRPEIQSALRPRGRTDLLNSYLTFKVNTQNAAYNPDHGNKINFELGWTFNQHPRFSHKDSETGMIHPLDIQTTDYLTLRYYSAHYAPIGKHALYLKLNMGMHFGHQLPYLNSFMVGGNNFTTRNQILFPGFRLNGVSSSSAVTMQAGFRARLSTKFSLAAGPGILWYDFISSNYRVPDQPPKTAGGLILTAGYDSIIGPIEISMMYNTINERITSAFNLGYSMNFSD